MFNSFNPFSAFNSGDSSTGNEPVFTLPLTDNGSGAVNLLIDRGTGSATFTRAGATATTIGSSGLIIKAIAANVARSYYDPTTLSYMGYVSEGARTNLCLQSEDFSSASWTKVDTTITADNTTSPDGTANADLLTEGTAGTAQVAQAYTATANTTQSVSRWVKRGNHDWVALIAHQTGTFGNRIACYYNLNTGAVGTASNVGTATGAVGTIKAYPNGWYRLILSGAVNNAATGITVLTASATADNNGTRVNNGTRFEWGAQFEDNAALASTYIPTTAASVTRNADVLSYLFSGNMLEAQGTMYADFSTFKAAAGSNQFLVRASDAGFNNAEALNIESGGSLQIVTAAGGVFDGVASASGTVSNNTLTKGAASWGANGLACCRNGGTVATDSSWTTPGGLTIINIGSDHNGTNHLFGTIKNVRIWNMQLSDAYLQNMTS